MGLFGNGRCPGVSTAICDNPTKLVLNILQFAHVETRQTSEKRVTVVQMTTQ